MEALTHHRLVSLPLGRHVIFTAIFNTVIGLALAFSLSTDPPGASLILSHSIGFTLFASFYLYGRYCRYRTGTMLLTLIGGSVLGVSLGAVLIGWLQGLSVAELLAALRDNPMGLWSSLTFALLFGGVGLYFVVSRTRIRKADDALREERFKRLEYDKKLVESQLRLLQAQIEPHFLFNTLSNIAGLIETDPGRGKKMLEDLTRYLRGSLRRSRSTSATLAQELALIQDYLALFQVRMGDRLEYQVAAPESLMSVSLPPMLLQPLVENAVKHGIEPAARGGSINIAADSDGDTLRLTVADTGMGLQGDGWSGFGLANVRERLRALYGDAARLTVNDNRPRGVRAVIEVPYDAT